MHSAALRMHVGLLIKAGLHIAFVRKWKLPSLLNTFETLCRVFTVTLVHRCSNWSQVNPM